MRLSRWLFLRLLGLVYLIAFVSLWVQVDGLLGSGGISPAADYLAAAERALGDAAVWRLPTLVWLAPADATLHALCAGGVALSVLLVVGVAPAPALFLLWLAYLSLTVVGQEFLSFQWDVLLLETGLLAVLWAPLGLRPRRPSADAEPPAAVTWLKRWLLFRLMFASGVVKLLSGDPAWRDLTALDYHYWTQPLPAVLGWYLHQAPVWLDRLSMAVMYAIELAVPFLMLAPLRRARAVAAAATAALMAVIAATGSYGFFNLLTAVLCVPLLDDEQLRRLPLVGRHLARLAPPTAPPPPARRWSRLLLAPPVAALALLSLVPVLELTEGRVPVPGPLAAAYRAALPLRSVNSYGLFRVMTRTRPEIVVEGSDDGVTWRAYRFRFKPGALDARPRYAAPHMPRLDWQMWFAALGDYRQGRNAWFVRFCRRLLDGAPEVVALLAEDPFPDGPPQKLRATLYLYSFTDRAERAATGAWWRRERRGPYLPVVLERRAPRPLDASSR